MPPRLPRRIPVQHQVVLPPFPPVQFENIFAGIHNPYAFVNLPVKHQITASAETRARGLLESLLSPAQTVTLRNSSFIDLRGSRGGQFRVFTNCGVSHNVYRVDTDPISSHCYHLDGRYPVSDHIMAQLMIIRQDQDSLASYPAMYLGLKYGWTGYVSVTLLPPYVPWTDE